MKERAARYEEIRETARANPLDKFSLGIREAVGRLMIERMGENGALVTRYMSDSDFQEVAFADLSSAIYDAVGAGTVSRGRTGCADDVSATLQP